MRRLVLFATLFAAIVFNARAYDFSAVSPSGHRLYYNVSGCNAIVTYPGSNPYEGAYFEYTMPSGSVIIPDSVIFNGNVYVVTQIGLSAFYNCANLTEVSIPNTVSRIEERAFANCGLISLVIPNSVTYIGNCSFINCGSLITLTIGCGIETLHWNAFHLCENLETLYFNAYNCTSAGTSSWSAFRNCTSLSTVYIGENVTNLPSYLFLGSINLTNLIIYATTPPTLGSSVFAGSSTISNMIVRVPCQSISAYQNSWGNTYNFQCLYTFNFNLTINSNDSTWGTGSYTVLGDSTAEVTATANYGYHFDHWSYGSTANPDTLLLSSDVTITAIFEKNQYSLTVSSNDANLGSVVGGGTYEYLDTIAISATAIEHYHFVRWDDGNRDNPRQVVVTGDLSYIAHFAIDTHTVSVLTNDIARGMVEATGIEFAYGTPCTVTATAYTGYTFAGWSNGVTANPYTFAVLNDVELTALFVAEGEQTYTVTVVSDDPTMGTVSGGGQALDGGTVTIRAVGNPGYHFLRWNDNNTDSVRTVEVHGNVTYTAYFASNSTETIDDVNGSNIKVYAIDGRIVVEGRENRPVWVLDMYGRVVDNGRLPSGVYLVNVGNLPARKVVVIR